MSPLAAAMILALESGSIPHAWRPRAALTVREQPDLWLSVPVSRVAREGATACGLLGCDLSKHPPLDSRSLAAHTQTLILGAVGKLGGTIGVEPVSHAASWLAASGLLLDVRPQRVLISLRLPTP